MAGGRELVGPFVAAYSFVEAPSRLQYRGQAQVSIGMPFVECDRSACMLLALSGKP